MKRWPHFITVTDPARKPLADDDSKASAVTAALKRGGVLEKDVQTTNLQIQPQDFQQQGHGHRI